MKNAVKIILKSILTLGILSSVFCTVSRLHVFGAETVKESAYQEVKKDGRLYVFSSSQRKADFEKSGELGKGIIKIGYGRNGETVVFDSEDAVIEYEARLVKEILGKANIKAYREAKINDRLYVFTSPTRKENFEKSGELGVSIIKIGYGPNGETVVFDSDEAVKEYHNRHPQKHVQK
jgi:YHS domain-containing protein